jgi:Toastrack DUF4097
MSGLTGQQRSVRLAGIAFLSATLGACDLAFSGFREQATDVWTKTYPLSENGRVEVANTNGFIKVEAGERSDVEVHAERIARGATVESANQLLKSVEIVEEASPDRVRLESRRRGGAGFGRGGWEVQYTLRVPARAQVELRTTNGDVTAVGLAQATRLATTNGAINGRRLEGEVRASTTNGGVDIELASVTQPVRVSTTNGGVSIQLPSNAKANVHVECTNGGINVSDLNLEVEGELTRRRVSGRMNGGGPRVEVSTTNGGITISAK